MLIESKTPELSSIAETSSKANTTSSKPAVTSKETTTTSKAKPETSFERVSTSSQNAYVETKSIIPHSFKPNGGGTSRYMYAEEMCDDPELLAEIEAINEEYNASGLEVSLEGKGNKISFVFKFLTQVDAATLKEPLEEALKAQKETFNFQVAQLQTEVMTKMVLGIKYVNADGTVIYEAEYPQ